MKQTCKAEVFVAPFKEKVSPTLKLSLTTPVTMEAAGNNKKKTTRKT